MAKSKINFYPVILAGGRGTRFWPLSRKRRAKQLLSLDGKQSMLQQTVARLLPLATAARIWVITNGELEAEIARQLPRLRPRQIVAEPVGRNTAPAIGLAAFLLLRDGPEAVIGLFPSDHVIGDEARYRQTLKQGIAIAAAGENIVVLGIQPTRPETGYGYIEAGYPTRETDPLPVRRFTEKPDVQRAAEFLNAGNYYWNSGMFLWRAQTLVNALREHLPNTATLLEKIADTFGTKRFETTFKKLYPKCENISVDYAVLEPRSAKGEENKIFCLPADFGWNDLGSWTALHEHHVAKSNPADGNLISAAGSFTLNAEGNYVHAPGKFVAAVGVSDIVVVETEDALLITNRRNSQDVGKVVKHLDEKKLSTLV